MGKWDGLLIFMKKKKILMNIMYPISLILKCSNNNISTYIYFEKRNHCTTITIERQFLNNYVIYRNAMYKCGLSCKYAS